MSASPREASHDALRPATPNYHARRVSFEDALASTIRSGAKAKTVATSERSLEVAQLHGNNVNLDTD